MVTLRQYLLVTAGRLDDHPCMAATDTPLVAARRIRLREWIKTRHGGSRQSFLEAAEANGFALNPSEVSNLQNGKKSFGENKAAQYELAAGMPPGYLVKALDPPSQPAGLDLDTLRVALVALQEAAAAEDLEIDLYKSAPIIAFAYRERQKMRTRPTKADLRAFDERIRKELRGEDEHGEWGGRALSDGAGSLQADAAKASKVGRGRK